MTNKICDGKINFFIEETIRRELDKLSPTGQKSTIVNGGVAERITEDKAGECTIILI